MYLSRKLKPAETRYSTIERECLAVVWAVKTLHAYLYGREFVLMSDHQPLAYLNSSKYSNNRVMRWALDLQAYRFRVQVVIRARIITLLIFLAGAEPGDGYTGVKSRNEPILLHY